MMGDHGEKKRPYEKLPFEVRIDRCAKYIRDHKKEPSQYSNDKNERRDSEFIRRLRAGYRNMNLIKDGKKPLSTQRLTRKQYEMAIAAKIDLCPRLRGDNNFDKKIEDIKSFKERIGKWPSEGKKRKGQTEKEHKEEVQLAKKMHDVRRKYRNQVLIDSGSTLKRGSRGLPRNRVHTVVKSGIVDENTISDRKEANWRHFVENVQACVIYKDQYGVWPSDKSDIDWVKKLGQSRTRWREGYRKFLVKHRKGGQQKRSGINLFQEQIDLLLSVGLLEGIEKIFKNKEVTRKTFKYEKHTGISRRLKGEDVLVCKGKRVELSVIQCGADYIEANALFKNAVGNRSNPCFNCRQGASVRTEYAKDKKLTFEERQKLGIKD